MMWWTGQVVVMMTMCVTFICANNFNIPRRHNQPRMPSCPSSSKPCRTRAIMQADFLPAGSREIQSPSCACQSSSECYEDWEAHSDRVITRELVTNGNISMTFSMMFCHALQSRDTCQEGQVALQLSGWTPMPTELDFINCACPDRRPLVLHSITTGADHRQYHAYVCYRHKKKCKRGRRNRDICMESDPESYTIRYPCKCTSNTSCQQDQGYNPPRYYCKR